MEICKILMTFVLSIFFLLTIGMILLYYKGTEDWLMNLCFKVDAIIKKYYNTIMSILLIASVTLVFIALLMEIWSM